MPDGAVYVGRPSKWENPYRIGARNPHTDDPYTRADVLDLFRRSVRDWWGPWYVEHVRRELTGRDLVCWCSLDQPCHADVLLEIANGGAA